MLAIVSFKVILLSLIYLAYLTYSRQEYFHLYFFILFHFRETSF